MTGMNIKKWIALIACLFALSGAVLASIAIVNAQTDSEESVPDAELSETETVDMTGDLLSEETVYPSLDIPKIITASHMMELTGAEKADDPELVKAALELYAGQNVKYRVRFYMSYWADQDMQDEYYRKLRDGLFGTIYYQRVRLSIEGYPSYMYADLTEEALREILSYEGSDICPKINADPSVKRPGTVVILVDEIPLSGCGLFAIDKSSSLDIPEVVTASHMMELTGAEKADDPELVKAALELYAGQDVKYRVGFYLSFWEEEDIKTDFYRQCKDGSFGTVYSWNGIVPAMVGYPERQFAELTEEALRAVLSYEKTVVYLIDEIPEEVVLYTEESTPAQ